FPGYQTLMLGAPEPRFRIYTKPSSYGRIFADVLAGCSAKEPELEHLEKDIARLTGSRYAISMPTARTGIYLTLASLIKPGQKVLLSPITIVDVINMVLCAGGIPHFIDTEDKTCNIDAAQIEKQIDPSTGAVLITHLHGLACDVERIRQIC